MLIAGEPVMLIVKIRDQPERVVFVATQGNRMLVSPANGDEVYAHEVKRWFFRTD
jgi:hypothetical protein